VVAATTDVVGVGRLVITGGAGRVPPPHPASTTPRTAIPTAIFMLFPSVVYASHSTDPVMIDSHVSVTVVAPLCRYRNPSR